MPSADPPLRKLRDAPEPGPVGPRSEAPVLQVSALLLVRDRRVLMVRARGRDVLYLPGGKAEPGESAVQAAVREAHEETGLTLTAADLDEFAVVTEPAHGQAPGTIVRMTLFLARSPGALDTAQPVASAEVDEIEWVTADDADRCPPAGVETLRLLVRAGLLDEPSGPVPRG